VEILVELFVPRVEDEDLEGQRGCCDQEVCDGETACDYHLVSCCRRMSGKAVIWKEHDLNDKKS